MDKIALTNVRVFDGERLREPATVVIDGDRVGGDPAGARAQDGGGRALLPGLGVDYIKIIVDPPGFDELTVRAPRRVAQPGPVPVQRSGQVGYRLQVVDADSTGPGRPVTRRARRGR